MKDGGVSTVSKLAVTKPVLYGTHVCHHHHQDAVMTRLENVREWGYHANVVAAEKLLRKHAAALT